MGDEMSSSDYAYCELSDRSSLCNMCNAVAAPSKLLMKASLAATTTVVKAQDELYACFLGRRAHEKSKGLLTIQGAKKGSRSSLFHIP